MLIIVQASARLYNKLDNAGKKYKHRMDLNYNLFKGASFKLEDLASAEELAGQIAEMPEIKQIWPVREYPIPSDKVVWTGNSGTAAPESVNSINKRQSSGNDTFSPHVMTQVDLLRADGIRGALEKAASSASALILSATLTPVEQLPACPMMTLMTALDTVPTLLESWLLRSTLMDSQEQPRMSHLERTAYLDAMVVQETMF
jgi:hypothetical protein